MTSVKYTHVVSRSIIPTILVLLVMHSSNVVAQLLTRPAIIDTGAIAQRIRYPVIGYMNRFGTLMKIKLPINSRGKVGLPWIEAGGHDIFDILAVNAIVPVRMTPAVEEGQAVSSDVSFLLRFALSDTSFDRRHDSADLVVFPLFTTRGLLDTSAWPLPPTEDVDFGIVFYNEVDDRWVPRDSMPGLVPVQVDMEELAEKLADEEIAIPQAIPWNYVLVRLLVRDDGTLISSNVVMTDDLRLNAAALRAVQDLRFIPATRNGTPVASWMAIPLRIPFSVRDPAKRNPEW